MEQVFYELVSCQRIWLILLLPKHLHELSLDPLEYDVVVHLLDALHHV